MSLPAIRLALADILAQTPPVTVTSHNADVTIGMNQSLPYQPDQPPEVVPCAWLGYATWETSMGSLEVTTWSLPITVAVYEAGSAEMELASVEAFLEAVMAQLRTHQSLNFTADVANVLGGEEGEILFRGKAYRGFTLTTAITVKTEVAAMMRS